jgi:hypothetical protein
LKRALLLVACAALACGKGSTAATVAASPSSAIARDGGLTQLEGGVPSPEDPLVTDLWTRAGEGDGADLARLYDAVGSDALIDASPVASRRTAALRALAFADDFTPLPFLAKVAASGTDADARVALESVASLAARPRLATDPDDALEIHDGCAQLLALAKDVKRPVARRVLAVSALRLLADRGWVLAADVPTDLDAH